MLLRVDFFLILRNRYNIRNYETVFRFYKAH